VACRLREDPGGAPAVETVSTRRFLRLEKGDHQDHATDSLNSCWRLAHHLRSSSKQRGTKPAGPGRRWGKRARRVSVFRVEERLGGFPRMLALPSWNKTRQKIHPTGCPLFVFAQGSNSSGCGGGIPAPWLTLTPRPRGNDPRALGCARGVLDLAGATPVRAAARSVLRFVAWAASRVDHRFLPTLQLQVCSANSWLSQQLQPHDAL